MLQKEKVISDNLQAVEAAATFSIKSFLGLTIEIYGGSYPKADGTYQKLPDLFTVNVPDNSTSFIEYDIATEQVVVKTAFTAGNIAICSCTAQEGYINGDSFEVVKVINFHVTGQAPGGGYNLPQATTTTLGGVKIDPETLGFNESGQLKVIGGGGGGTGSLIVQSNGTTINNNTTTLNIKSSNNVTSSGNTVSIDSFYSFENCIAWWRPVNGNVNTAFTFNSWTTTAVNSNVSEVVNPSNIWDVEHVKILTTGSTALSQSRLISNQASLKRTIFTRNAAKTSFGYDRRGNITKLNTAYFAGIQQDSGANTHAFVNNYATVNSGGICGIGWRATDENLHLIYTSAVTSQVVFQDLGSNFPIPEFSTNKASYDLIVDSDRSDVDVVITLLRKDVNHSFVQTVPFFKQTGSNSCKFSVVFETQDAVAKYIGQGSVYIYSR